MILKWGWSGKGRALRADLLSEVFEGEGEAQQGVALSTAAKVLVDLLSSSCSARPPGACSWRLERAMRRSASIADWESPKSGVGRVIMPTGTKMPFECDFSACRDWVQYHEDKSKRSFPGSRVSRHFRGASRQQSCRGRGVRGFSEWCPWIFHGNRVSQDPRSPGRGTPPRAFAWGESTVLGTHGVASSRSH